MPAMTMPLRHDTLIHASKATKDDEPWPIWAAIMVFLNVLVFSGMTWGLAGLVTIMVPAALGMLVVLLLIVKG
jgi:hypothetical protein